MDRLPKTRSGKILRATMVKIADGEAWKMPATIDDPAMLDEIAVALRDSASRVDNFLHPGGLSAQDGGPADLSFRTGWRLSRHGVKV